MNAQGIGQLGIGLLGVWAFIVALGYFRYASFGVFSFEQPGGYTAFFLAWVLPFVVLLVLSYLLVVHAAAIARRLLLPLEQEPAGPPADVSRVVVGLVGVFVFLGSLPGLLASFGLPANGRTLTLVADLVRAGVGLLMVLRPALFLAMWQSERPASASGAA
jgi:hypothetical protein